MSTALRGHVKNLTLNVYPDHSQRLLLQNHWPLANERVAPARQQSSAMRPPSIAAGSDYNGHTIVAGLFAECSGL
jgi:hypothetical protein